MDNEGAPTQDAKPLSAQEINQRREEVENQLAAWIKEKPVSYVHSDRRQAFIARYELELRYLATIDRQSAELKRLRADLAVKTEDYERWRTESERWQREHDSAVDTVVRACLDSRKQESGKQAPFLRDMLLSSFDPLMMVTQRLRAAAPEESEERT